MNENNTKIKKIHPSRILFEDNHILVVNKLAGELVQGDSTEDVTLLEECKAYIKDKYNKPGAVYLAVVHRIDRPTSGVIIYARTSKAAARLTEQFKNREIDKTYWAVVRQLPEEDEGTLVHYLKKNQKNNRSHASRQEKSGYKKAVMHYRLAAHGDRYVLLEVNLETGRHHQIRAQLSAIGSPIKGDLKYGFERSNDDGSISLHARKVSFTHPVKKEPVTVTAPVPNDHLWKHFEKFMSGK
jgi:23S rRNA pseudouridine1911/1915/1917 synthase